MDHGSSRIRKARKKKQSNREEPSGNRNQTQQTTTIHNDPGRIDRSGSVLTKQKSTGAGSGRRDLSFLPTSLESLRSPTRFFPIPGSQY